MRARTGKVCPVPPRVHFCFPAMWGVPPVSGLSDGCPVGWGAGLERSGKASVKGQGLSKTSQLHPGTSPAGLLLWPGKQKEHMCSKGVLSQGRPLPGQAPGPGGEPASHSGRLSCVPCPDLTLAARASGQQTMGEGKTPAVLLHLWPAWEQPPSLRPRPRAAVETQGCHWGAWDADDLRGGGQRQGSVIQ